MPLQIKVGSHNKAILGEGWISPQTRLTELWEGNSTFGPQISAALTNPEMDGPGQGIGFQHDPSPTSFSEKFKILKRNHWHVEVSEPRESVQSFVHNFIKATHCNRVQYMYSKVLSQSTLTLAQSPTLFVIFHNI